MFFTEMIEVSLQPITRQLKIIVRKSIYLYFTLKPFDPWSVLSFLKEIDLKQQQQQFRINLDKNVQI